SKELHRQILEGERRPMEQFKQEVVRRVLGERRYCWMAERAIGLAGHAGEVVLRNGVTDKRPDHIDRDLGIGPPGEAHDRLAVELRPRLRHIETTVAGQTREQHVDEAERRSLATGGNVTHGPPLLLAASALQG